MDRDEERPGFFRPFSTKILQSLSKSDWEDFRSLETDGERIRFVYQLPDVMKTELVQSFSVKDANKAEENKTLGNRDFQARQYSSAAGFYSRAAILAPSQPDGSSELAAVCVGNRSACVFRQRSYQLAIQDINYAVLLGFPTRLVYKLNDRKARCHLALRQNDLAIKSFQNVLKSLDRAEMSEENKLQWKKNTQNILDKVQPSNNKKNNVAGKKFSWLPDIPNVTDKPNLQFPSASNKVSFSESDEEGRFAVCSTQVNVGDVLLVEKAYASVLRPEKLKTHCLHCHTRVRLPVPCSTCSGVVFCSWSCRQQACSSHHRVECEIMQLLVDSGMSVTCLLSLRLATVSSSHHLLQNWHSESRKSTLTSSPYSGSHCSSVHQLVSHREQKNARELFPSTLMAVFMLRCLEMQRYFGQDNDRDNLSDQRITLGEILLHYIHLVPYNAHEVSELRVPPSLGEQADGGSVNNSVSEFLAAAVFPTLALFNHCCDPAIVRYFCGNTVVARAVRRISPGEQISENYGPIFTQQATYDRQKHLQERYRFTCHCQACEENWPTFEHMDNATLKFKCSTCKAPIGVDTEAILMPILECGTCHKETNIMKTLKILQDTESTFTAASRDIATGELDRGLKLMIENLHRLDSCLYPPQRDFYLCQQAIRNVFLSHGNSYVSQFCNI